jgi:ribulose-5-phosphate 4-epimerase/fuculose-1-phosphate aldolase
MMMLRNHGVLTAGKDVPETFTYLYFLMKACEIQVKAQSCGPTHMPSEQAIRTTADQPQALGGAAALTWPALVRLLDSKNPGYAV